MNVSGPPQAHAMQGPPAPVDKKMMALAQKLEAGFLAEMLKSAGLGEARETFGGGAGEEQFSSFLVQEYANIAVAAGGIGLAESIYRSLVRSREVAE